MVHMLFRKLRHEQSGITGIETAIILIAFVVVAAVFSYAVLSAGLFASQKSQESIYNGLKQAQSALEMKGAMITRSNGTNITQMTFTLASALGGQPIDFTLPTANPLNNGNCPNTSPNKVVISYLDPYQKVDDLYWTASFVGYSDGNSMLDREEMVQITIGSATAGAGGGNLLDALAAHPLGTNTRFTIEIKTPIGSTLSFERTTPGYIENVMNLN
jgi:archaeal flagellin FlaB